MHSLLLKIDFRMIYHPLHAVVASMWNSTVLLHVQNGL